jgi:hypothetical protein
MKTGLQKERSKKLKALLSAPRPEMKYTFCIRIKKQICHIVWNVAY